MELRVLHYFLTVAREESISGAAAFLHLTQPTLSRQLIELEKELGVTLFLARQAQNHADGRGRAVAQTGRRNPQFGKKTEAEIQAPHETIGGDIHIGGGETHAMRLVAGIIQEIQRAYPAVRVHVHSGNADDVMERLDKGLLDFGLLIEPVKLTKYHSLRLPARDVWGVLMRKDSPLAAQTCVRPQDLWDLPLISSRQRLVDGEIGAWLQKDYQQVNVVATYNLVYNASLLVEAGIGYAFCLDQLVNTTGESALCFRPLEPPLTAGLVIVWKKYQVFSKAAALFLRRLRAALQTDAGRS